MVMQSYIPSTFDVESDIERAASISAATLYAMDFDHVEVVLLVQSWVTFSDGIRTATVLIRDVPSFPGVFSDVLDGYLLMQDEDFIMVIEEEE